MNAIPQELLGLRVPEQLGDERVAALLQQKRPWICSRVAQLQQLPPHRPRELVSGESFPYLGRHYRLKVQDGHAVGVCLTGGLLRATVRPQEQGDQRRARIRQYLERWYRARALERLQQKADRYARQMGVTPAGVGVRVFRARWGSCDRCGQLLFNWPIIKAPHPVVDYVVIHGLAHLVHPNHSRPFWLLVERHCPGYARHRSWLKDRARELL